MLLGLQLRPYYPGKHGNELDTTLAVMRACEDAELDSALIRDHFMFKDPAEPNSDWAVPAAFVTLGAMAAITSRIRIGPLVTCVPYRNPAWLAKLNETLDAESHERAIRTGCRLERTEVQSLRLALSFRARAALRSTALEPWKAPSSRKAETTFAGLIRRELTTLA